MKRFHDRFEKLSSQSLGFSEGVVVFVDKQTGVNYLFYKSGYGGGLTPLLDGSGNVVVSPGCNNFDPER